MKSTLPPGTGPELGLFDSLDTSLRGIAAIAPSLHLEIPLGEIERDVTNAIQEFDARDPARVVEPHIAPALRNVRALIQNVTNAQIDEDAKYDLLFRLRNKEDEFMRAGNLLLGLSLEALVDAPRRRRTRTSPETPRPFSVAIPGQKFSITATVTNRSSVRMEEIAVDLIVRGHLEVSSTPIQTTSLGYDEQLKQSFEVKVQEDADYTRPYWSRQNSYRDNLYHIDQPQFVNLPWAPPEITATVTYRVGGVRFSLSEPGRTVVTEPLVGEVAPAIDDRPGDECRIAAARRHHSVGTAQSVHRRACHCHQQRQGQCGRQESTWNFLLVGRRRPAEVSLHFDHESEVQNADFKLTTLQSAASGGGQDLQRSRSGSI